MYHAATAAATHLSNNSISYTLYPALSHTWARGGTRGGDAPPYGSKTSPLPYTRKMGTHNKKPWSFLFFIPSFLDQRSCIIFSVQVFLLSIQN